MTYQKRLATGLILLLSTGCGDDGASSDGSTSGTDSTPTTSGVSETQPNTESQSESNSESDSDTDSDTDGDPGLPPPTPVLVTPDDGEADVEIEVELCWEPVEDPEGDPVRYRVWVDDIELDEGKLGEPGHAGPCIGPLNFNFEQEYAWTVSAFNPDHPESESDQAAPYTFLTTDNGISSNVFEDPFDDDLGWEIEGEGDRGWMRGNPVPVTDGVEVSQPGDCAGGENCYFTGQNENSVPNVWDVEGVTSMTSPEFDLSGFATASVNLSRFFYKSAVAETGTLFRVELLVPDAAAPGGYQSFVLEQLESEDDVINQNIWQAVEYDACGVEMAEGSRLRITAADLGDGVTEAALDSVVVTGYHDEDLCNGGEGSICDPNAADACSGGLLCCAQGTLNTGVYRCAQPAQGLDLDNPPANQNDPPNGAMGCDAPDLLVLADEVFSGPATGLTTQNFQPNDCAILEGCVGGPGLRDLLRFNTYTPNIGSRDMTMGVPANHPDLFHFSQCHNHWHFDGYATYELLDDQDQVVAEGHKQAFCLIDLDPWTGWPFGTGKFGCSNQGISYGWADVYSAGLDCNWIDVTDVPPGDYTVRLTVNGPAPGTNVRPIVEMDYSNNVTEVPVTIP